MIKSKFRERTSYTVNIYFKDLVIQLDVLINGERHSIKIYRRKLFVH